MAGNVAIKKIQRRMRKKFVLIKFFLLELILTFKLNKSIYYDEETAKNYVTIFYIVCSDKLNSIFIEFY